MVTETRRDRRAGFGLSSEGVEHLAEVLLVASTERLHRGRQGRRGRPKNVPSAESSLRSFTRERELFGNIITRGGPRQRYVERVEFRYGTSLLSVFKNTIDAQKMTYVFPIDAEVSAGLQWSDHLDPIFVNNYESDPTLSWQYYGATSGFLRRFPGRSKLAVSSLTKLTKVTETRPKNALLIFLVITYFPQRLLPVT